MDNPNNTDYNFQQRFKKFSKNLEKLGKRIPEQDVKGMIQDIFETLEKHHVTYDQARKILQLVDETLTLRATEVRM